jgi:trans-aconitate methyltransferase
MPDDKDARLLDLGCGAGLLMEWLRNGVGFSKITGIDADLGQVKFAQSLNLDVEQVTEPWKWLKSKKEYDVIIMKDVLEHIPDDIVLPMLTVVWQALSERGTLILTVPNANSSFASRYRYIDYTHLRSYTEVSLASELRRAGILNLEIRGDDVWRPRSLKGAGRLILKALVRTWRRLEAIAELGSEGLRIPLSLNLLCVCRKQK